MSVENTSTSAEPRLRYAMGIESIEDQEARGAEQVAASDLLPVHRYEDDSVFEEMGFILGDVVEDDPLFQHVTLPEGWSRKTSGHDMWTYIEDDEGVDRVAVFYKAAFYDRRAFCRLCEVTP